MAVSGHQFGYIYTGPIGLVLTPFHHGMEAGELPSFLDGFDPTVLDPMIDAKMDMGVHMVGRGV